MNSSTPVRQYVASEKAPETEPLLGTQPYVPHQPHPEISQDYPRNARRRRFWHFFACTVLFLCAMKLLVRKHWFWASYQSHSGHTYQYGPSQCSDTVTWAPDLSPPSDHYPFHAQTSFELPVSVAEHFFVSEGALQSGEFNVLQDLDAGSDSAVVEIHVSYRLEETLDEATVCRTHPDDGTWGLGIFTPTHRHPHDHWPLLRFYVTLHLPSASDAPVKINNLHTHLPIFAHHLHDLSDSVYFERLDLSSSNAPIIADSVTGNYFNIHTSNAHIGGEYAVSTSLVLKSSNGPITATAKLINGNEQPTELDFHTSNAHIDGKITLVSNTSDATQGSYVVKAHSSNGALLLAFADAPVDSTLSLDASSSNGPVHAKLHPTYEGTFDVSTSLARVEVTWPKSSDVEDPAGKGRTRRVQLNSVRRGHASGQASWAEGGEKRGKVVLHTSLGPVKLEV